MLTKSDIKALRTCNSICVHLTPQYPDGLVRAIKRAERFDNPLAMDAEHVLPATVGFWTLRGRAEQARKEVHCFAMVNIYRSQKHMEANILQSLREGDILSFHFYPDAHTNGYCAAAGLHGDVLKLQIVRNGKSQYWEFASSICPNNSARMIYGVPDSEDYRRQAEQARSAA